MQVNSALENLLGHQNSNPEHFEPQERNPVQLDQTNAFREESFAVCEVVKDNSNQILKEFGEAKEIEDILDSSNSKPDYQVFLTDLKSKFQQFQMELNQKMKLKAIEKEKLSGKTSTKTVIRDPPEEEGFTMVVSKNPKDVMRGLPGLLGHDSKHS
ncbi:unnamed protein product [Cuscuta europaea]|uniref:Uncharacterized protein n=1 Tax=Cuscuta europaea TaxID=41803 RepID=A0A9P0ZP64_CUSEU|nr:unnamed protein product [Cuscuta europaea]